MAQGSDANHTYGILVGGGPAPGINGVIGAAATTALRAGSRVLGIVDGCKWLIEGKSAVESGEHVRDLTLGEVEQIHLRGGSILHTSRANPTKNPDHLASCVATLDSLGVDRLITIGGDDTAFSAKSIADAAGGRIQVAHVPKTIDNDLPLPVGVPTFGFETAREQGQSVIERIHEDCRTTNRWFIVIMMGRHAGHLALGTAMSAGAPVGVIREEFTRTPIRLDEVVRVIEGAIVKGLAAGNPSGVAVVAEGVAELLDPNDLEALKDVPLDEHGHIRLAEIPFGKVLSDALKKSLGDRGVSVAFGTKDVGYELRCATPSAFDREYTRHLGVGAVETLRAGKSGVLITRQAGRTVPVSFEELMDPKTGRTRVRMVDVASDIFKSALALQSRVTAADLADADRLAAIAAAAGLSPTEARQRYAPLGG